MTKKLSCIMLIDDNANDNFFHEREINKSDSNQLVVVKDSGELALEYISAGTLPLSNLILLDINMPGMNGWEFLKKYGELDIKLREYAVIIMLTTSDNIDDRTRASEFPFVKSYTTKPLTRQKIDSICKTFFI
ncbi:MAG: response regulator [Cyclobacteriaceae bacterium]|nr:response regulator [Cyclobacteriaceae bacterium]